MTDLGLAAGVTGTGVLITGAGGAIGRAIAAIFVDAGARVALTDVDADKLHDVARSIPGADGVCELPIDIRDDGARSALLGEAADALGRVDVLVHAAAVVIRRTDVAEVSASDWDLQQAVNLRATFFLTRDTAERMRVDGRGGRIVLLASQAWWTGGLDGSVVYAATKGGVVSLARGLARSYAPDGININCIAPGAVDTSMLRDGVDDDSLEQLRATIPIGRFAEPEEIAGVALFLASLHSNYMTGTTLNVTGGLLTY